MLAALKEELRRVGVTRIDTAAHFDNPRARSFYERLVPGGKLPDAYVAHLESKTWPGNVR